MTVIGRNLLRGTILAVLMDAEMNPSGNVVGMLINHWVN